VKLKNSKLDNLESNEVRDMNNQDSDPSTREGANTPCSPKATKVYKRTLDLKFREPDDP